MSQVEARAWWADVEHRREAAERRQAAESERRAATRRFARDSEAARARSRATSRLLEEAGGTVDELSALRAVVLEERRPRPRRPVPIWLADDVLADPVATARARAAAPRRTVEIRGQIAFEPEMAIPAPRRPTTETAGPALAGAPVRRTREQASIASSFAARPDRVAFWAFALGLILVLVAATSGHAAVL
jgi:hypothetical protein